jgi:hypothetical protein
VALRWNPPPRSDDNYWKIMFANYIDSSKDVRPQISMGISHAYRRTHNRADVLYMMAKKRRNFATPHNGKNTPFESLAFTRHCAIDFT